MNTVQYSLPLCDVHSSPQRQFRMKLSHSSIKVQIIHLQPRLHCISVITNCNSAMQFFDFFPFSIFFFLFLFIYFFVLYQVSRKVTDHFGTKQRNHMWIKENKKTFWRFSYSSPIQCLSSFMAPLEIQLVLKYCTENKNKKKQQQGRRLLTLLRLADLECINDTIDVFFRYLQKMKPNMEIKSAVITYCWIKSKYTGHHPLFSGEKTSLKSFANSFGACDRAAAKSITICLVIYTYLCSLQIQKGYITCCFILPAKPKWIHSTFLVDSICFCVLYQNLAHCHFHYGNLSSLIVHCICLAECKDDLGRNVLLLVFCCAFSSFCVLYSIFLPISCIHWNIWSNEL